MRKQPSRPLPLLLLAASLCVFAMSLSGTVAGQGRLRPPTGLSCDRNSTTSFTGRITAYSRTARRIFIRVDTDEQTTEQFTIPLRRGEDASKRFLIEGKAFSAGDWKKVERARGILKPQMRATIWACRTDRDDFRAELIDWRPNEQGGSFVTTALKLFHPGKFNLTLYGQPGSLPSIYSAQECCGLFEALVSEEGRRTGA